MATILRSVFAGAPVPVRRSVATGLVMWLVMMAVQGFFSAKHQGPAAAAEFLSALCGSAGGILLAFTGLLNASAEQTSGDPWNGREAEAYRRMLLALPAVGLVAGMSLSAAVALMLLRAMLGTELPFVIVLTTLYVVLLVLAASTVMRATRVLYAHAQAEAHNASAAHIAAGEARLAALQARMNPHFLFNALNTVAALVRREPAAAERVVENLSGVLRTTLARSSERMSTVAAEEDYLRAWLAVEHERWQERLRIEWEISPEARRAALPPLVLQPLVENALAHGLGGRLHGGSVRVTAAKSTEDVLILRVEDDGVGFPAAPIEGTGLGNLRQRLASVYGDRASVTIEPRAHGAAVIVTVPYEEADAGVGR